jgi:hypothetical protein
MVRQICQERCVEMGLYWTRLYCDERKMFCKLRTFCGKMAISELCAALRHPQIMVVHGAISA